MPAVPHLSDVLPPANDGDRVLVRIACALNQAQRDNIAAMVRKSLKADVQVLIVDQRYVRIDWLGVDGPMGTLVDFAAQNLPVAGAMNLSCTTVNLMAGDRLLLRFGSSPVTMTIDAVIERQKAFTAFVQQWAGKDVEVIPMLTERK